jgi:hypothetical protein
MPLLRGPNTMTDTCNEAGATSGLRAVLLPLLLLTFAACGRADHLTSDTSSDAPDAASSPGSSGIPFGAFALPGSMYGSIYTGGHVNPERPEYLLSRLAEIRAAGARVVLALAGGPANFTNADGTFNFDLWKGRVARYSGVDFTSYIEDRTVLGHYLIDQPNCGTCWGGQAIPQDVVEAMAQYSKSIWPTMTTVTRADPTWLEGYSGQYVYLDAGWAQYVARKGTVESYLAANLAAAQSEGLGLIVGLNLLNGGPDGSQMTAKQVKAWGATLLGSPYACAFISWKYESAYFSRSDIASAMEFLSSKAKRHTSSSCQR